MRRRMVRSNRVALPVALLSALVVLGACDPAWGAEPLHERIDQLIAQEHHWQVSPPANDSEFLRRIYLDLTGRIPTASEAREFLEDANAEKRARLIDRLLDSLQYVRYFAGVFDVMLMERRGDTHVSGDEWRQYLQSSFEQNKPYNQLAHEILAADADSESRGPAKFYLDRGGDANLLTREVGRIFFGQDLQCAQCHDHPLIEDYLQSHYYGIFAFLNRSFIYQPNKETKAVFAERAEGDANFKSVFTAVSGTTLPRLPGGTQIEEPTFARGEAYAVKPADKVRPVPKYSRRLQLAKRATDGSNRAFNQNIANRLWGRMMARGLVQPVDLHHAGNPPAHPQLLGIVADEFVAMGFDIKAMLRELALSQTYQRSIDLPANWDDDVAAATESLTAYNAALESAEAATEEADQSFQASETLLYEARDTVTSLKDELAKTGFPAAQKTSDDAFASLDKTKGQIAEKQDAAKSVSEVVAKVQEAVSKLPDDKSLANAAEQIAATSKRLTEEIEKLARTAKEQSAALEAADSKLAEVQEAARGALESLEEVEQALSIVEGQFDQSFALLTARRFEVQVATARIARANALVEYRHAHDARAASQSLVAKAKGSLEECEQSVNKSSAILKTAQVAVAEAQKTSDQALAKLAEARKQLSGKQKSVQKVAEAASKASQARIEFPEDKVLAEVAEKLAGRVQAYTAELKESEKGVSVIEEETKAAADALTQEKEQAELKVAQLAAARNNVEKLRLEVEQAIEKAAADLSAVEKAYGSVSRNWSHQFASRPLESLSPEQFAWSVMQATGLIEKQRAASVAELNEKNPPKPEEEADPAKRAARAKQIEQVVHDKLKENVGLFVKLFGSGAGQPQDDFFATVDQALFLTNGGKVQEWLAPSEGNLVDRLSKLPEPEPLAEELYLSVLTRRPSELEIDRVTEYMAQRPEAERTAAATELVWALLTSAEFRFNH